MILEQVDKTTEVHSDVELTSKEFDMDKQAMSIIFRGFSDSLYSNKIGSIVREITSNAFDAHAEAKINQMVKVGVSAPNGLDATTGYFTVEDFGVGLSPERIDETYTKYGASTKRNTNDEIGGFGIGAKSPLAYADSFMLITRSNGTEYQYIVHRGEQAPVLELVDKDSTDEPNGTKVMIPIKTEHDANRFRAEIKAQLRYFENIYHMNTGVDNDYSLFKGENFITAFGKEGIHELHLCIGRVYYPLDYSYFDVPKSFSNESLSYSFWDLNLAIYCDIGDVSVTMSRESVEYTDKTIKVIQDKLDAFAVEFEALLEKAKRPTTDLIEYLSNTKEAFISLPGDKRFYLPWDEKLLTLEGLPVVEGISYQLPDDPFLHFRHNGSIDENGKFIATTNRIYRRRPESVQKLLTGDSTVYRMRANPQKRLSLYIGETQDSVKTITLRSFEPWKVAKLFKMRSTEDEEVSTSQIKELGDKYFQYVLKQILKYTISYEDTTIPKAWLDEYLSGMRSGRRALEDKTGKFNCKHIFGVSHHEDPMWEIKSYAWTEVQKLLRMKRYIVYAGHNEKDKAKAFWEVSKLDDVLIHCINNPFHYHTYKGQQSPLTFLLLSKEVIKILSRLNDPRVVHVDKFWETPLGKNHLKRIGAQLYADELLRLTDHLGTLFPRESKFMTEIREFSERVELICQDVRTKYQSEEVLEFVKNSFDFFNKDMMILGNKRFSLRKINSFLSQVKEKAPWALELSANNRGADMYSPLVQLIKNQVKSTLLYE